MKKKKPRPRIKTRSRLAINSILCALGSQKLYDFPDHNPCCASYSVDYTNNPERIASNDNMMAINNADEVDLCGQVSSESTGMRQILPDLQRKTENSFFYKAFFCCAGERLGE